MEDILFVFGSARGGTTFVSTILDSSFSYGMATEGTFVKRVVRRAKEIGDLSNDANCYALAEEILNSETFQIILTRWRFRKEARFDVSPEEIIERMPDRSVSSAVFAAFKVIADKRNKKRVGNKNPGYWRELDTLHALFPSKAKYLFVIRDGRDVALSLKNVPWGGHSIYEAARIWVDMIDTVRAFEARIEPGSLLTIRYEDLLAMPGQTIESIGNFIGQNDMTEIRANYEKEAKQNQLRANFEKWRTCMSPDDQQIFEAIAGEHLKYYGYGQCYPEAMIGFFRTLGFVAKKWLRLVRLNIYHLQSKLPLDTNQSKKSKIADVLKPGNERK